MNEAKIFNKAQNQSQIWLFHSFVPINQKTKKKMWLELVKRENKQIHEIIQKISV